jgi:hypothetical protein
MKNIAKISLIAFVLSGFIFLIAALTALIDTPTFINRIQTTIIAWQLPLIAISMILYGCVKEQGSILNTILRAVATLLLTIAFFCTNITKNIIQDVASNIENYVDIAEKTIKSEGENLKEYEKQIERAVEDAEDNYHRNRYRDEDYW